MTLSDLIIALSQHQEPGKLKEVHALVYDRDSNPIGYYEITAAEASRVPTLPNVVFLIAKEKE